MRVIKTVEGWPVNGAFYVLGESMTDEEKRRDVFNQDIHGCCKKGKFSAFPVRSWDVPQSQNRAFPLYWYALYNG